MRSAQIFRGFIGIFHYIQTFSVSGCYLPQRRLFYSTKWILLSSKRSCCILLSAGYPRAKRENTSTFSGSFRISWINAIRSLSGAIPIHTPPSPSASVSSQDLKEFFLLYGFIFIFTDTYSVKNILHAIFSSSYSYHLLQFILIIQLLTPFYIRHHTLHFIRPSIQKQTIDHSHRYIQIIPHHPNIKTP